MKKKMYRNIWRVFFRAMVRRCVCLSFVCESSSDNWTIILTLWHNKPSLGGSCYVMVTTLKKITRSKSNLEHTFRNEQKNNLSTAND